MGVILRKGPIESCANIIDLHRCALPQGDPAAILIGDRLMGNIHFVMGDQAEASRLLQSVLDRLSQPDGALDPQLVYNQRALALSTLAQVQFLRGEVDHALRLAEEAVREGQAHNDLVSEFYALMQAACPTAIFAGQLGLAEQYLVRLDGHGQRHRPYANWIPCLRGLMLLRQGSLDAGAKELAEGIARLDEMGGISANHNRFKAELVAALIKLERFDPASQMLSELERQSKTNGEALCDPEILRLRAELLHASGGSMPQAETLLEEAIQLARRQTAKVWELRSANSLASLRSGLGRSNQTKKPRRRLIPTGNIPPIA